MLMAIIITVRIIIADYIRFGLPTIFTADYIPQR